MGNVVVGNKLMHGVVFEIGSEEIVVNGQNSNALVAVNGYTGVCGLTSMPEEAWEAIKKKYGSMTAIQKGFIYAEKNESSANAASKEKAELQTGAEQAVLKETEKDK